MKLLKHWMGKKQFFYKTPNFKIRAEASNVRITRVPKFEIQGNKENMNVNFKTNNSSEAKFPLE